MADFDWKENSKEMFDKLIAAPPLPLRPMVKKSMLGKLEAAVGAGGAIDPAHVVAAVRESTPKPFVANALKNVVDMYSCPATCEGCSDKCPLSS